MQAQKLGTGVAGAGRGRDAIAFAGKEAREQVADTAVVIDQQEMRGIVGGTCRRACERGSERHGHSLSLIDGGKDRLQHLVRIVAVDHRAQEALDGLGILRRHLGECLGDARGLEAGGFCTSASPFGVANSKRWRRSSSPVFCTI